MSGPRSKNEQPPTSTDPAPTPTPTDPARYERFTDSGFGDPEELTQDDLDYLDELDAEPADEDDAAETSNQ